MMSKRSVFFIILSATAAATTAYADEATQVIELKQEPTEKIQGYWGWHCDSLLTSGFRLRRNHNCSAAQASGDEPRELNAREVVPEPIRQSLVLNQTSDLSTAAQRR